jgi:hypothetical protein
MQIERLRKQERQWPVMRWVLLAVGVLVGAIALFIAVSLYHLIRAYEHDISNVRQPSFPDPTVLVAMFWPQCLVMCWVSGWFIVKAVADWNGNANRILLLKLLDEHQAPSPSPSKTA